MVSRCGDRDRAYALLEEAHTIFEKLGDQVAATWTVNHLGDVARRHADPGEARRLYQRAVERFGILGDLWGISRSSADLAYVTCDTGDYPGGPSALCGSARRARAARPQAGIARVFDGFAYLWRSAKANSIVP